MLKYAVTAVVLASSCGIIFDHFAASIIYYRVMKNCFWRKQFHFSSVALIYCSGEYVISKSVFHSYRFFSKSGTNGLLVEAKWTAQSGELLIGDNFHVSVLFEGIYCSCVHADMYFTIMVAPETFLLLKR